MTASFTIGIIWYRLVGAVIGLRLPACGIAVGIRFVGKRNYSFIALC